MIRKFSKKKKWGLYSLTSGKRLGTFTSKKKAKERERQIQYFKHKGK